MLSLETIRNPNCKLCPYHEHANHVCMMGKGPVPARVMLIGESPGENEDQQGIPFVGRAGAMLSSIIGNVYGFPPVDQCYITNVFKCHPVHNAKPKTEYLDICSTHYLRREIKLVKPQLIICLGVLSAKTLMGDYAGRLDSLRNIVHYTSGPLPIDVPFIVTYHPAATFHQEWCLNHIVADFEWAVSLLDKGTNKSVGSKRYKKIQTLEEINSLDKARVIDLDLETDGLDAFANRKILSCQISIEEGKGYYLDWNKQVRQELSRYLTDHPSVRVNGHNIKHDLKWLKMVGGIAIPNRVNDTLIDTALLDENFPDKSLDVVAQSFTPLKGHKDELKKALNIYVKLHKEPKEPITKAFTRLYGEAYKALPEDVRVNYGCGDADATGRLRRAFAPKIKEAGLTNLQWLMRQSVRLYSEMECNGVKIDVLMMDSLKAIYAEKIVDLSTLMKELSPLEVNPKSPSQLVKLLYGTWKCEPHPIYQGKKRLYYSTGKKALELIQEDVIPPRCRMYIEKLLEYRKATKLYGTYLEGMPRFLRNEFLHAMWNLVGTETGRSSCKEPNLQQIPRKGEINRLFRSRWDSGYLISSDCSQGELRIEAHTANEPTLCRLFNTPGNDVHTATAALLYGCSEYDVTEDQRFVAKTFNFAVLYGSSPPTIAAAAKISVDLAYKYQYKWFKQFPRIREHIEEVHAEVLEKNYVRSLFGRYRHIMVLEPESEQGKSQLRSAFNSPIQGGLGDLNKLIGINIRKDFEKHGLAEKVLFTMEVHDAWKFDCKHKKYLKPACEIIRKNYEQVDTSRFGFKFKVPITTDIKVGKNGLDMEAYNA